MAETNQGVCMTFDGSGGIAASTPIPPAAACAAEHPVWFKFDQDFAEITETLRRRIGLDEITVESLLAIETRPRCMPHGEGALLILRGVNFNPGAEPEDMIAVRMWIDDMRVVSIQHQNLLAVDELARALKRGNGPKGPGDFLVMLADGLTDGMQETVEVMDEELDRLEDAQGSEPVSALRADISRLRRKTATVRRFIAPQRDALDVLIAEPFRWQNPTQERRLKDIVDRITRLVEQLDEIHTRAAVFQESLAGEVAERLNRTMVVLSVIAGIFLPLSFIAGVLGMNVSGIPGAASPWAFAVVLTLLAVIAGLVILLFKKYRLL